MDVNTCYETTNFYHTIANYTHYLPIIISFFLAIYLLVKTKRNLLSQIFFWFVFAINFWLVADIIAWTNQDYNLIHAFWSLFDYVNVIFFLFGLYFFVVLINKKDIEWEWKMLGLVLTIPAFIQVVTGNSVHEFDHTVCESINDDFLTNYKNYVEAFVMAGVVFFMGRTWFTEKDSSTRKRIYVVGIALMLFFITFASSDYFSVQTGIYEIGLYSLFIIPIFLGMIVYSIVKYEAFNVAVLGAQALVITLITLVGAQFFFITSNTNKILNSLTFLFAILFGQRLIRGVKRDVESRKQIEKFAEKLERTNEKLGHANVRLKDLDQQKSEFISLATHQIRGPLSIIKGYASLALEGDYGKISKKVKDVFEIIMQSSHGLVILVNDYLDISRIDQGRMQYDLSKFDMKNLVDEVINEFKPLIKNKKIKIDLKTEKGQKYQVFADMGKIKQVIGNLVDNAIKYTPEGDVKISLSKEGNKILLKIKDNGVGIKKAVLPKLFSKFTRSPDAKKTNILGTGLGLFVAKKIIEYHKGRIWAESEGEGKGAEFFVELEEKK